MPDSHALLGNSVGKDHSSLHRSILPQPGSRLFLPDCPSVYHLRSPDRQDANPADASPKCGHAGDNSPHRHSIQALEQYFTTCYNIITGSNSPANLAGQPLPDTLGDEPDKYDEGDEAETSAPNLIPQRSKTFDYSLNTWASSPSKPEGFIWGSLHAGDHRRFQVWCPKCGKHHPITKEQFRHPDDAKLKNGKWDYERIIEETWHECPHNCGYRFTESDKHRAYAQDWTASKNFPNRKKWFKNLADYEAEIERLGIDDFRKTYPVFWLPSNEEGGRGHNSYHLPSWYSPDGKCSFGELRCQYLRARSSGRIQDMQDVYNQTFAEAFDITTYGVSRITDLPKGAYELGDHWEEAQIHLTDGKPVRILALDRQQASFWGVCRTVGIDGSTRLFWEGELATFDECDLKAQELGAQTVLCDVSFKLKETLSECHKRGWIGMRGEPKKFYPEMLPATKEFPHGQTVRVIYRWANYRASCGNDVATLCWASQGGQDQLAALATHPEKIWTVCATPSNEYVKQMQSKHYDKNQWTKKDDKAPDHLWDCESEIAVWLEVCGIKNEVNAS